VVNLLLALTGAFVFCSAIPTRSRWFICSDEGLRDTDAQAGRASQ
jgi:hypothetical protein